jgi:hypothetical protein
MKRFSLLLSMMFVLFGYFGLVCAEPIIHAPSEWDPPNTEAHLAYEWATYVPDSALLPGADLNAPGDMIRHTIMIDDKYSKDPNYKILKVEVGVHIDDYDWSKGSGDQKPEWGSIRVNGRPMMNVIYSPDDKRKAESSIFMEIVSDVEMSPEGKAWPSYVFEWTGKSLAEAVKKKSFVVEVKNLRKDGSVDSDAAFGNFVVNRMGLHVYYGKK